jgi:hypothetical protein
MFSFFLFTMLACTNVNLRAADQGGDKSRYSVNEENRIKTGEEQSNYQVIYHDMIDAYQKGQFIEARRLARLHLQRFRDQMDNSTDERERESTVHAMVDVLYIMLDNEEKLPDSLRFERAADLFEFAEEQMLHARDVFDSLSKPDDRRKAFITDKLGKCSERWMRTGKTRMPRKRLEDHQKKFRTELESIGYTTVDNVLNKVKPDVPQIREVPPVSDEDRGKIFDLIDAFYRGIISGDKKLIAAVSGLNSKKAAALLQKYNSELQQKGITNIIKVTLPEMSADNYTVRQSTGMANMYFVAVQGIRMDIIQTDGAQSTVTGDKLFGLKKEMSGAWILELPERK